MDFNATKGVSDKISRLCGDKSIYKELWYGCILCGKWYHAACTSNETPKDFICDFYKIYLYVKKSSNVKNISKLFCIN